MNYFTSKFDKRINSFWDNPNENEKQSLLGDILRYANASPKSFKSEIKEIQFDDLSRLPIVLEALAKDTEKWGQFYCDLLDDIIETAKVVKQPNKILTYLSEFAYIEKDEKPFLQTIVDRKVKELNSEFIEIKLAVIRTLPNYLDNENIKNRKNIIGKLHQLLADPNWKIRVATFKSLNYENLLPVGYKLNYRDKLLKLAFGEPEVF